MTIFVVYMHLYVLYFVLGLDFLFVFCFTILCAFIIIFLYYSSIQLLSCKCVFIKLLCVEKNKRYKPTGALKMQEWKKQEWKMREQTAGVEKAGAITDGKP